VGRASRLGYYWISECVAEHTLLQEGKRRHDRRLASDTLHAARSSLREIGRVVIPYRGISFGGAMIPTDPEASGWERSNGVPSVRSSRKAVCSITCSKQTKPTCGCDSVQGAWPWNAGPCQAPGRPPGFCAFSLYSHRPPVTLLRKTCTYST
jgi:hypothetical protein